MFGVIIGLIGVLCLLLYFGMTAIEVLIKYSLLALRFIFWIIPLWIKAAAWFFYGGGWLLYHMTVNKQLLRQIRESEKLKNAYDYEYKQAWQREQDEFKLMIPVEKYPYADRELLGLPFYLHIIKICQGYVIVLVSHFGVRQRNPPSCFDSLRKVNHRH